MRGKKGEFLYFRSFSHIIAHFNRQKYSLLFEAYFNSLHSNEIQTKILVVSHKISNENIFEVENETEISEFQSKNQREINRIISKSRK